MYQVLLTQNIVQLTKYFSELRHIFGELVDTFSE